MAGRCRFCLKNCRIEKLCEIDENISSKFLNFTQKKLSTNQASYVCNMCLHFLDLANEYKAQWIDNVTEQDNLENSQNSDIPKSAVSSQKRKRLEKVKPENRFKNVLRKTNGRSSISVVQKPKNKRVKKDNELQIDQNQPIIVQQVQPVQQIQQQDQMGQFMATQPQYIQLQPIQTQNLIVQPETKILMPNAGSPLRYIQQKPSQQQVQQVHPLQGQIIQIQQTDQSPQNVIKFRPPITRTIGAPQMQVIQLQEEARPAQTPRTIQLQNVAQNTTPTRILQHNIGNKVAHNINSSQQYILVQQANDKANNQNFQAQQEIKSNKQIQSQVHRVQHELTVHERESAKMLVLLDNCEQRLITFTLPRKACTLQELLQQVGISIGAKSNVECIENPGSEIDYIVKIGNVGISDTTTMIKAAENHIRQKQAAQIKMTATQKVTQSNDTPNSSKLPAAKYVEGYFAVCTACGFSGVDHAKCERCHRIFTDDVKTVRMPSQLAKNTQISRIAGPAQKPQGISKTNHDRKDQMAAIAKKHKMALDQMKLDIAAGRRRGINIANVGMSPNAIGRGNTPKKPTFHEILTLSSDDETDSGGTKSHNSKNSGDK